MIYSNKFAIFCRKQHQKIVQHFKPEIELYDDVNKTNIYGLPLAHYVQINNRNFNIIIDDILDAKQLIDKNNNIYYYIGNHSDHNIHYPLMKFFMEKISVLIADPQVSTELLRNIYGFKKEIVYV